MPQFKSEAGVPARRVRTTAGAPPFLLALLTLAIAAGMPPRVRAAEAPAAAAAPAVERFLDARAARFVDWLADGSMLIATRFGDTQQIHRLRAPLGMREQLSFEHGEVMGATARPFRSDAFVYQVSGDGGRTSNLRLMRLADHAPLPLTHGDFRDELPQFAHDGKLLAFSSNRGNEDDRAIFVLDSDDPTAGPKQVAGGAGERWRMLGWTPDDRRLLLGRESAAPQTLELYFLDLASLTLAPIQLPVASAGRTRQAQPPATLRARSARMAPDGHGLLVLGSADPATAAQAEFATLRYIDPGTGETRELLGAPPHDVERFDASADGRYLAYVLNDEGVSRLMLSDQKTRIDTAVAEVPAGIIHALKFDAQGTHLALSVESAQAPEDVYVYEPATHALTRWSAGEQGPLDPALLESPQLRHFPTWDRVDGQSRMLSAYVYGIGAPLSAEAPARPVLIVLRGAAGAQFRPGYDPLLQYLVNDLRFVVVAPNLRGASGSGRSFRTLGEGALRDDAARDVGSLLAWVGLQEGVDRERVFVMGEGAADSLALAVLAQYGDRLQGGIAVGPPVVPPLMTALTIRRPLLLVAARTPAEMQADAAIAVPNDAFAMLAFRLRQSGGSARYLGFGAEASGWASRTDRDARDRAIADFLAQLLR
jgi:dipeptidyl aminopeptidase/acylaminoacyl peptidase